MASLELFASPPGTGKTFACIEHFKDEILKSKSGIHSRSFFVLPSQEHADRIQSLILRKDIVGLFNAHIVTINDLASRLPEGPASPQPSDALRLKLVREILGESLGFDYLKSSLALPGFHRLCVELIKEFQSSLLSIAELEKRSQPLLKDPVFRLKFKDMSVLLKQYKKRLALAGFEEPEEGILRLAKEKTIKASLDLVVLDGFYHFSRAQEELIRLLTRISKKMVVTLTVSEKKDPNRESLFYYPERTRSWLLSVGFSQRKSSHFLINRRFRNPSIGHAEKTIFCKKPEASKGRVRGLTILEAPTVRGEMEMIAREIRRLAREESWYLSDICILFRNVSPYQKIITSVFELFQIPVHVHERTKLKETALGAWLYRFLNLGLTGWKEEDVFYGLKSSLYAESLRLESVLYFERLAGSRRVTQDRHRWLALAEDSTVSEGIRRVLNTWAQTEDELTKSRNGRDFASILQGFAASCEPKETRALEAVRASLKKISRLSEYTKNEFSPAAMLAEFQMQMETALFSVKPDSQNCVQVYDVVMALPKEYKVVFVAGLLEKVFPQNAAQDAFLKDEERRVINRQGIVLEERALRMAGERYFFYMALTRSRERIYLSYPLQDLEARPCLPSFFIEELGRCFKQPLPKRRLPGVDFLPAPQDWETQQETIRGLAALLGNPKVNEASKKQLELSLPTWFHSPEFEQVLEWMKRTPVQAIISDTAIKKRTGANQELLSATRLEVMAACAFRYHASETLKLNEPPDGREIMEIGSLLHKVLEIYFKSLTTQERQTGGYVRDPQAMKAQLKKIFNGLLPENILSQGKLYRFEIQRSLMEHSLDLFVEAESDLFEKRGFVPAEFEKRFGYGPKKGSDIFEIQVAGETVPIRGQIDRLDMTVDGKKALVVDYKLSKRPSIHGKLEDGLELQLPLYILAAQHLLGVEVLGAEHRYLKEPGRQGFYREDASEVLGLSSRERTYPLDEWESLLAKTRERVASLSARIRKADISVRSKSCHFCQFSPVCRFEPWRLVYQEEISHD